MKGTTRVMINNKTYFEMEQGFFKVPNFIYELCYEMGLTRVERDIYLCLIRFQNGSNKNPFPGYKTLKKYTMIKKNNTIAEGIRGLEEKGLIEVVSRGKTQGQSNVYKVNFIYPEATESNSEGSKGVKEVKNTKSLTQEKKKPKNQQKVKENPVIPFRRGKHDDVVTSKEAQELIDYFESDEYKKDMELGEERACRILNDL